MIFTTKVSNKDGTHTTWTGEPNPMRVCEDLRFWSPNIHVWYHDRIRGVVVRQDEHGKLPHRYQKVVDAHQKRVADEALKGLDELYGD